MERVKPVIAVIENHNIATTAIRTDLMQALMDEGFEVYVLTEIDASLNKEQLPANIKMIDVGASVLNPLSAFRYNLRLYKALKTANPSLCLTFTIRPAIYGNIVCRLLKIPVISTITGTGPLFESNSFSYRIARWLYSWVLKKTKRVFFPNYDDLNAFVKAGYIQASTGVRVPGSGVNLTKFFPQQLNRSRNGKFIFLYISRLVKDKGILEYVEAASTIRKKIPNAEFHVIGPLWTNNKKSLIVTREELEDWIEKKWIVYHGEQKDIRPFIADADCVVMPSYREGMSNVLLEGAAMGRPLIATNVTGCRDIVIHGENGLLCKVRDGQDLALRMEELMQLPVDKLEQMGKSGRQKVVTEFDKKIVVKEYLRNIREVLYGSN